jgi:hypothetical protein
MAIMLVVGFVSGAVVADIAFNSGEPASGDVPIGASDGPLVTVTDVSSIELTEFTPDSNTVEVTSDVGNATLSSNGRTNVTLDEVTGTWTNASQLDVSGTPLTINPEDKPKATVSGDADHFNFRSMTVDDGTVDFTYGGSSGSTSVTVNGLSTTEQVAAVDVDTNEVLDIASVSSGTATFDLSNSDHRVELRTSDGAPQLSDGKPAGDLSTKPSEVSVTVDDPDFPADNVTVTATLDGSTLGTKTVDTSNNVSFSISSGLDAGQHDVTIEATDVYGQTTSTSYEFTTPDELVLRNETSPGDLVKNNTTVSVTFFGDEGAIIQRTTTNGTIDMTGVPTDQTFVVQAEANGFHTRSILIKELWQQQTIYLLSITENTVLIDFVINDETQQFIDDDTRLLVQKTITVNNSTEYRTITGDFLDATGEVSVFLQRDQRYRLVAKSGDQVRSLGTYTATTAGKETLTIGQVVLDGETDEGVIFKATTVNETGDDFIRAVYVDEEVLTSQLDLDVYRVYANGSEKLVASRTVTDTLGKYSELIQVSNATNNYRLEWEAQRDGETITGNATVGELDDITDTWPISSWVLEMLGMVFTVAVGGLLVIYDSSLAGIGMVVVAGFLTAVGVLSIPAWALAPAGAAAILFQIGSGGGLGA